MKFTLRKRKSNPHIKEIKIQPKKIILPKHLVEQYNHSNVFDQSRRDSQLLDNNNEQYNKSIIETFSPTKFELDNSVRFNLPKVKSTGTLKQIINKDALGSLYQQSTERDFYFKVTDLKKNKNQVREDMSKVSAQKKDK